MSFADPVTDILTLVVFYTEGHKTWFGVGLAFVILPCFVFPFVHYFSTVSARERDLNAPLTIAFQRRDALRAFLIGFNPFSAALVRLRAFYLCMKHRIIWSRSYDKTKAVPPLLLDSDESDSLLLYNKLAPLVEALLESAPQGQAGHNSALCHEFSRGACKHYSNDFFTCILPDFSLDVHSCGWASSRS